ncbi:MAG: helix-turn-helix domain-containing protein [Lentisphaerae bacterium]|nr:helix-turn-helix domain-containing protein [Lentisphaerota bacterium]
MNIKKQSEIIDTLGGTNAVAKLCEVRSQAVSQWRNNGIPKARLMYLKLARPEVFKAA